jgi:hypothetical protein
VLLDFVLEMGSSVSARAVPGRSAPGLSSARGCAHDAALERNFFGLPPEALALIQQGLDRKAALTYAKLEAASQTASGGCRRPLRSAAGDRREEAVRRPLKPPACSFDKQGCIS